MLPEKHETCENGGNLQIAGTVNSAHRTVVGVEKVGEVSRDGMVSFVLMEGMAADAPLNQAGAVSHVTRQRTRRPVAATPAATAIVVVRLRVEHPLELVRGELVGNKAVLRDRQGGHWRRRRGCVGRG